VEINLPLVAEGKVRRIYAADEQHLLIVTTDRISAFDVVMPTMIPNKGIILTQVANFWFDRLSALIPNHMTDKTLSDYLSAAHCLALKDRAIIVKKLKPLPIEAIVRGYLVGSGWKDYETSGQVCGITLPEHLQLAEKLPTPLYTPSTKAHIGQHDENISFAETVALLGEEKAHKIQQISLTLYQTASAYALSRGIIIADTKFEFGEDDNGTLYLIDEVLTPDSSRFWPVDLYRVGHNPPSFDKQFVRDYLESLHWDKTPPGPTLPKNIVDKTAEKYQDVASRLMTQ